jgi:hypothetical protein
MKAEGRLAPVQEPRLRAILNNISEEAELSRALRDFVEFTPSLFAPMLQARTFLRIQRSTKALTKI